MVRICFLIEADGARRLPCKVPESWEPVIYQKSTRVLAVYGLDAVGKSFREACFRPGLAAENFGEEDNRPDISSGYCAAGT